ncbi:MAG TPA: LuxR C-terminal-related transcriptional regulator [Thermomicrobiales bacterium]|nr:LuxR C-terminal-related transcriptional regulator [Thermomicrobiales bacterium]
MFASLPAGRPHLLPKPPSSTMEAWAGPALRLPTPLTTLLGREREIAAVCRLLRHDDVRLLALTGPGGVGKTHLALTIARRLTDDFPDGVAFVPLAAVHDAELVAPTLVQALEARSANDLSPLPTLRDYLRDRRLLLTLDNFEQVAAAAPLLTDLLVACPGLAILVTSRARLHLHGEHDFPVPPLAVPEALAGAEPGPAAHVAAFAGVQLFVERAQAVDPAFALTEANAAVVAEICRRLDGLPLALELAAARTRVLSPAALLARLANRLAMLTDGPRDVEARLRAMRDAIAWSHDLLSPTEQVLFRRLAAFVGGFSLQTAEQVASVSPAAGGGAGGFDMIDGVTTLVDGSLLWRDAQGAADDGTEPRFGMLETIREYALARLAESGEEATVRDAHAACCLRLAEDADPALSSHEQATGFRRLEAEHANLRAALGWLCHRGDAERGARLASALSWFWSSRGHLREARGWFDAFLAMPETAFSAETRAKLLLEAGNIAQWQGDWDDAAALVERSHSAWLALGHQRNVAITLRNLTSIALDRGDPERAAPLIEQSLILLRQFGSAWDVAFATLLRGRLRSARGEFAGAIDECAQAERLFREIGDRAYVAAALGERGFAALRMGDAAAARATYAASLTLARELDQPWWIAWALAGAAELALRDADPARAARLLGAATALRDAIGAIRETRILAADRRTADAAQAALGADGFAAAFAEGRSLPVDAAIAEALAPAPAAPAATLGGVCPEAAHRLTRREVDVLRLVVEGQSDKEIASALSITRRTASQHVATLLVKLGARSRTAAASLALRCRLV